MEPDKKLPQDYFESFNKENGRMKTYCYGDSIYSDLDYTDSDYYKISNTPAEANFLFSTSNNINKGLFRKENNDLFTFYWEESVNVFEEHIYDYNFLRLDPRNLKKDFIEDGIVTFQISLEGYNAPIAKNELILRQFQCIVLSDKDNLNAENWDITGFGTAKKGNNEGLLLKNGGISLNNNIDSYPNKTYIDSNEDTKYRAVFRIFKDDNTASQINFKIGNSEQYIYDKVSQLDNGPHSFEITYEKVNEIGSWKFFVDENEESGFSPTGVTELYSTISANSGQVEILELKNQVFHKINYSDSSPWASDFTTFDSQNVGGVGETNNDLTYSDISLDREIICVFNEDLFDFPNQFEDVRLWSDLEYYTNNPAQSYYDPEFQIYDWNPLADEYTIYGTPVGTILHHTVDTYWGDITWPEFPTGDDISEFDEKYIHFWKNERGGYLEIPSFEFSGLPDDNIFVVDVDLNYKFKHKISPDISIDAEDISINLHFRKNNNYYHLSRTFDEFMEDNFRTEENTDESINPRDLYKNQIEAPTPPLYNDPEIGKFRSAYTYTDQMEFDKVFIGFYDYLQELYARDFVLDAFYYTVLCSSEPNSFENYLRSKSFAADNLNCNKFYVLNKQYSKAIIKQGANYSCDALYVKDFFKDKPDSNIQNLDDIIFHNSFGKNALSFGIGSKVSYPNFAYSQESISAKNVVNDFRIVPKLKSEEGRGLKDTIYPYRSSWWSNQEFALALPFNLTFDNIDPDELKDISDVIFKVDFNVSVGNFDSFSWRPGLKIFNFKAGPEESTWLPYRDHMYAYGNNNDKEVWNYFGDNLDFEGSPYHDQSYDSIQSQHAHTYYFNSSDQACSIVFKLARDKYDFEKIANFSSNTTYLNLLGLIYVIPGIFEDNEWNTNNYEFNFDLNGRLNVSGSLSYGHSYTRAFKKTDVVAKSVKFSNEQFENPYSFTYPYLNLTTLDYADNISRIVDVYGITHDPETVVLLPHDWYFNYVEKCIYLPFEALVTYEHFNFTMEMWTDLIQKYPVQYPNRYYINTNLHENVTIIENVVGEYSNKSLDYFAKNFESDLFFYSEEPYFIRLNEDGSIWYIEFINSIDTNKYSKIRAIIHEIYNSSNEDRTTKTQMELYNTLKFPFAMVDSDDTSIMDIYLKLKLASGFQNCLEGITNVIRAESEYDVKIEYIKREGSGDTLLGASYLSNLVELLTREETYDLNIDLKTQGLKLEELFDCFVPGKELVLNISSEFSGIHRGKRLFGRFSLEILSAELDVDLMQVPPSLDMVELTPSYNKLQFIDMTNDFPYHPAFSEIDNLYGYDSELGLTQLDPSNYSYGTFKEVSSYVHHKGNPIDGSIFDLKAKDETFLTISSENVQGI
ncbi:hypothetical protein ES708_11014 [subsurface metagenome]